MRRRTIGWTLVIFLVLVSGAGGSALWLQGRELLAPAWLRAQIAGQLARAVPEYQITFGDLVAVVDTDWRPRFFVRNLTVSTADGVEVVSVANATAGIDPSALVQRRIGLTSLQATGVLVTMRRTAEGAIALTAGVQARRVTRQAPNLAQLINELDALLMRPATQTLETVDLRAITLRYEDLRAERAWTADGGRMRLTRDGSAFDISVDLALLGGASAVATLAASYSGVIGSLASDFGITISDLDAADIASQGPAFSWLGALQAPISGSMRGGVRSDGTINPLSATLQIGAGVIRPTPQASPIPIKGARSYMSYLPEEQLLRLDSLSVETEWGRGRLEGQAQLNGVQNAQITDLVGQFRVTDMVVNPDSLYAEPVRFDAAELDMRLSLAPFALEVGRFALTDQGEVLSAKGRVAAGAQGWNIAMDAEMTALSTPRLMELWPERIKDETRSWIAENVHDGEIREASAALRITQGGTPDIYLGFGFADADFSATKELPPIRNATGHASLFQDRFVIILDEGRMTAPEGGVVDAAGTSFIVPDTKAKPDPPGIVRLAAHGTVTAALSLLDQPPLEVMQKADLPVTLADGHVQIAGTLAIPLKKKVDVEEVSFDIAGTARDVRSDVLIKGRVVEAPVLLITASEDAVEVAGLGTLDGVPVDVVWQQPLGAPDDILPGSVTGHFEITQGALDAFGIDLPPGTVTGTGRGNLSLALEKGTAPQLSLRSDLTGVQLSMAPLGWSKPASAAGVLELDVTLGDAPRVDRLVLEAPSLVARGAISLTADQQLDRLRLDRVQLGAWLDAAVDIVGQGAGRPVAIDVRSGTVDLRRADLPAGAGGNEESGPLSVALDRLQISDTIALTAMKGTFSTNTGLAGPFTGQINGGATISGRITPQNNRSAIRITARDAGRVLASAGLLQQIREGQLQLTLLPVGSGGAFDGSLRISNAKVTNAPTIAALVNSISLVGLVNELAGDGIVFSEIDADFRLAPSRITLRQASAVGASMGLSMDGVFEPDTGRLQMQGVISPIYLLNAIGSVLTRPGEGLFGVNYSITGTASDPKVSVNPLTALAPGMLRNLFRRAKPEVPLEEGERVPVEKPRTPPVVTRGQDR